MIQNSMRKERDAGTLTIAFLVFSLNSGESVKGKMTGYAQYEVLIEFDGKKVILMKQAIMKIEVL